MILSYKIRFFKIILLAIIIFSTTVLTSKDFLLSSIVAIFVSFFFIDLNKNQLALEKIFIGLVLYLFVYRYVVLLLLDEKSELGRVLIPREDLKSMLNLISVSSFLFVITYKVLLKKGNLDHHRKSYVIWLASKKSEYYIRILYCLNYLGFGMMLYASGNLISLANLLFYHQKIIGNQNQFWQIGLTLWSLFSIPALTLDLLRNILFKKNSKRLWYAIRTTVFVLIIIVIFGGRLSILISGIITISIAKYLDIKISKVWILILCASLVVFLMIGSIRTGESANLGNQKSIILSSSYPVLDAASLVVNNPSDISNQLGSKERYLAYLKSVIPRFIWPNKPLLTTITLDYQIANTFGWENQRGVTGWPSGFVSEPFLVGSNLGVFVYVALLALFLAFIQNRKLNNNERRANGKEFILDFVLIYTLIAMVKDGDTFASLQSGIRIYFWLHVLKLITNLIDNIFRREYRYYGQ